MAHFHPPICAYVVSIPSRVCGGLQYVCDVRPLTSRLFSDGCFILFQLPPSMKLATDDDDMIMRYCISINLSFVLSNDLQAKSLQHS